MKFLKFIYLLTFTFIYSKFFVQCFYIPDCKTENSQKLTCVVEKLEPSFGEVICQQYGNEILEFGNGNNQEKSQNPQINEAKFRSKITDNESKKSNFQSKNSYWRGEETEFWKKNFGPEKKTFTKSGNQLKNGKKYYTPTYKNVMKHGENLKKNSEYSIKNDQYFDKKTKYFTENDKNYKGNAKHDNKNCHIKSLEIICDFQHKIFLYDSTFKNLENLRELKLKNCKVETIKNGKPFKNVFKSLTKFELLDVTFKNSKIRHEIPSSIQALKLIRSGIMDFSDFYNNCPFSNLEYIDLSYNEIKLILENSENKRNDKNRTYNFKNITQRSDSFDEKMLNNYHPYSYSLELVTDQFLLTKNEARVNSIKLQNENFRTLIQNYHLDDNKNDNKEGQILCEDFLKYLNLSHNNIEQIHDRSLSRFKNLQILNLSNNKINYISENSFKLLNRLLVLDLSYNLIDNLPNTLFKSLENLREIFINHNLIKNLKPFSYLTNTEKLDLSNNLFNLSDEFQNIFSNLTRLSVLNLSFNKITFIPNKLFTHFNSLYVLNVSHNSLDYIQNGVLKGLTKLQDLDLSHNQIYDLHKSSFNGLVGLSILKLDNNLISKLRKNLLQQNFNLKKIYISRNKLQELPKSVQNLSFLTHLYIDNNKIVSIEPFNFKRLSSLLVFNISSNYLGKVTTSSFFKLKSLNILDLSDNNIEIIEENSFDNIKGLKEILLSNNRLYNVNRLFAGLEYLELLDISHNNVSKFDYAFLPRQLVKLYIQFNRIGNLGNHYRVHNILALKFLNVSHNNIKVLKEESLPNSLVHVSLEYNSIGKISPGTFTNKILIKTINLRMNNITTLNPKSISSKLVESNHEKTAIFLEGNLLLCDCEMEWLYFASLTFSGIPMNQTVSRKELEYKKIEIGDKERVMCHVHRKNSTSFYKKLIDMGPEQFLCSYETHCFTLCKCCDFIACDCLMKCPSKCFCYHDDTWSINLVDCSNQDFKNLPAEVPMDATIVHLDGNNMKTLDSYNFIGRHSIINLRLNSSNIETLANKSFHGLLALKYLYLHDNKISRLNGFEFSGLVNLKELCLQNNRISYINNETFHNLTALEIIKLGQNLLKFFPIWSFYANNHLNSINLGNNPWTCQCYFLNRIRVSKNITNKLVENIPTCLVNSITVSWKNLEYTEYKCRDDNAFVTSFRVTQDQIPYVVAGLFVGLLIALLIAMLVVFLIRAGRLKNCNLSPTVYKFQETYEKNFDAYLVYSYEDAYFVSEILSNTLESNLFGFKLRLFYRDKTETDNLSSFITESLQYSKKIIIILSKAFLKCEWKNEIFKQTHINGIKNNEKNVIVINLERISNLSVENNLRRVVNMSNVIKWRDKDFWRKLSNLLPINSLHSDVFRCSSTHFNRGESRTLPIPRRPLPNSSSVLTNTTILTPMEKGRPTILHLSDEVRVNSSSWSDSCTNVSPYASTPLKFENAHNLPEQEQNNFYSSIDSIFSNCNNDDFNFEKLECPSSPSRVKYKTRRNLYH